MRISKPGSGLKLAPFRLPLSLSLPVAPPPYPLACSDSLANPLCRSSADVGVLCSPGCSLALSHPQCAHRTRPGRKSFPLRRANHARFFVIEPFTTYSIDDRRDTRARPILRPRRSYRSPPVGSSCRRLDFVQNFRFVANHRTRACIWNRVWCDRRGSIEGFCVTTASERKIVGSRRVTRLSWSCESGLSAW